jgi:hypothetical protein
MIQRQMADMARDCNPVLIAQTASIQEASQRMHERRVGAVQARLAIRIRLRKGRPGHRPLRSHRPSRRPFAWSLFLLANVDIHDNSSRAYIAAPACR